MVDGEINKTISKNNAGFPDYLNYDKLRSGAIEYLGNLTGKIWTDFNEHDPGITILEALIYALLDLGYRTNLPATDLFTRDPRDKSKDNNFFKPAQILGNNPLTITDYRKMLVDLEGVKNAWLVPEEKTPTVFCKPDPAGDPNAAGHMDPDLSAACSCDFLNGLYHVYVQLEDGLEKNKHAYEKMIRKIRNSLMAHRNLCEDFIDIKVLCKLDIGLCAAIELEQDADLEEVYLAMVEALTEFFSPAPKFYSLQQLLDKQRSMDEIFAGRPFNLTESHGFIDTEEFEQLPLRKELHLSDVYHLLSDIPGISSVRNLSWIKCCDKKEGVNDWKLVLPENYIPAFSTTCSGFTFTRNGLPLMTDLEKFDSYFVQWTSGQKALYTGDSAFLNPAFPQGVYRNDLSDYYSIQHEFPRVYGIGEGDLPGDANSKRKAQALQLQGFLLFFDQLLANYLTQLKNIRSLFSLSSSANEEENHTYSINELTNVPGLSQLLRFKKEDDGASGATLAYPTDRKQLQALIDSNTLVNTDLERNCKGTKEGDFPEYDFCFGTVRDQAISQLRDDLLFGGYDPVITANAQDCYFFYIFTSSTDFALISKQYYKDATEARNAAASLKYVAGFPENYRAFMKEDNSTGDESFSFDIELSLDSYTKYLQLIVEDRELYLSRRQDFLNHLLARFAETFSDYAILNAPFLSGQDLQAGQIRAEEKFLLHYDELSSCRGKAYDYLEDKWNSNNISGFEMRFKALAAVDNWKRHSLCNFVVEEAGQLYQLAIFLFNQAFKVEHTILSQAPALASLRSVYKKLMCPLFEQEYIPHEDQWSVFIRDEAGYKYAYRQLFPDGQAALGFSNILDAVFNFSPGIDKDVFVSQTIHKVLFEDASGTVLSESVQHFKELGKAEEYAKKTGADPGKFLDKTKEFRRLKNGAGEKTVLKLIPVSVDTFPLRFIDENEFECKPVDVIHLKEERKKFSALNKMATFQFDSLLQYPSGEEAEEGYRHLLVLLVSETNYEIKENRQTEKTEILISGEGRKIAVYFESFDSPEAARKKKEEIIAEVSSRTYGISITLPLDDEWEFRYRSEDLSGNSIDYESNQHYKGKEQAQEQAKLFYSHIPDLEIRQEGGKLLLELDSKDAKIQCVARIQASPEKEIDKAREMLSFSQDLYHKINNPTEKDFLALLESNRVNPGEDYIYKLVDKDNLVAYHPMSEKVNDSLAAKNIKQSLIDQAVAGYNYIDISLGTDILRERRDKKKKRSWYHYQVKCTNRQYQQGRLAGTGLVLFESTIGYASREEALAAFNDQYLLVLKYGRREKNYGKNKPVSPDEILLHSADPCDGSQSIVFIPSETSDEFGGYEVQKELAPLAASYPLQFYRKNKYGFVLGQVDAVKKEFMIDWRSKSLYRTPLEAMQQFRFFLMLLEYAGNFYMEWSGTDGGYHFYIREVLAISAHGFASLEEAWGSEGVEKMICVAQSGVGFQNYMNRATCNPGFYIACGNTGLVHPCVYETARRRDAILDKLYKASEFNFLDLLQPAAGQLILNDLNGDALATIFTGPLPDKDISTCEWLINFFESVYKEENYIRSGGKFYLIYRYFDGSGKEQYYKIAGPVPGSTLLLKEWKLRLQRIACYFPVRRMEGACGSAAKQQYFIEIKLPAFDCCGDDLLIGDPCKDPCGEKACVVSCYVAWKSDCCFDTCCDALQFYLRTFVLLSVYENYKPVYDCACGSFRIVLHPQLSLKGQELFLKDWVLSENKAFTERVRSLRDKMAQLCILSREDVLTCLSEIVAINPQRYSSELMACTAVDRALSLINSEGLHVVEHILLRPRCGDPNKGYKECDCEAQPRPCIEDPVCHFPWVPGGEPDPCEQEQPVCFTPGCDPYSFILTVALPAWPQRWRNEPGRAIIEKLLQREAPAHVLVRVLWLKPRDFCCFEYNFKRWTEWMAHKIGDPAWSNCDFLKILFQQHFDPLDACTECLPCSCKDLQPASCFPADAPDPCKDVTVLGNINKLYCWSKGGADDYSYCDPGEGKPLLKIAPAPIPLTAPIPLPASIPLPAPRDEVMPQRNKFLLIQARKSGYEAAVQKVVSENQGNKIAEYALVFLKKPAPSPEELDALLRNILADKRNKEKKIPGLGKKEKSALFGNLIWRYLDLVCVNDKNIEKITRLTELFGLLRDNGFDMHSIYEKWMGENLRSLAMEINFSDIQKCLEGGGPDQHAAHH